MKHFSLELLLFFFVLAFGTVALLTVCDPAMKDTVASAAKEAPAAETVEGFTVKAKIVRGVNGTYCDAAAIGKGNAPHVAPKEDLTNLSVSCSDKKKVTYGDLRAPLRNEHACQTTLAKLREARRDVHLVADPTEDNPYHCLLSEITPNQFVQKAKFAD